MSNPIFKTLYRGQGIYWHGKGYGDETQVIASTIAEMKAKIDHRWLMIEWERPEHEKYWDTLSNDERGRWRKACQTTELSASELAWTNRGIR